VVPSQIIRAMATFGASDPGSRAAFFCVNPAAASPEASSASARAWSCARFSRLDRAGGGGAPAS
jgi:hypothetical protein